MLTPAIRNDTTDSSLPAQEYWMAHIETVRAHTGYQDVVAGLVLRTIYVANVGDELQHTVCWNLRLCCHEQCGPDFCRARYRGLVTDRPVARYRDVDITGFTGAACDSHQNFVNA